MVTKSSCLKLINFIEKSSLFSGGKIRHKKILIAFSGGQDSCSLLTIFYILRKKWEFELGVVYCNHCWSDSEQSAFLVFKQLHKFGLPFYFVEAPNSKPVKPEQKARNWRYDSFATILNHGGYDLVLTGHSLSDCSETAIFNLIWGSGIKGICSLKELQTFQPPPQTNFIFKKTTFFLNLPNPLLIKKRFFNQQPANLGPTKPRSKTLAGGKLSCRSPGVLSKIGPRWVSTFVKTTALKKRPLFWRFFQNFLWGRKLGAKLSTFFELRRAFCEDKIFPRLEVKLWPNLRFGITQLPGFTNLGNPKFREKRLVWPNLFLKNWLPIAGGLEKVKRCPLSASRALASGRCPPKTLPRSSFQKVCLNAGTLFCPKDPSLIAKLAGSKATFREPRLVFSEKFPLLSEETLFISYLQRLQKFQKIDQVSSLISYFKPSHFSKTVVPYPNFFLNPQIERLIRKKETEKLESCRQKTEKFAGFRLQKFKEFTGKRVLKRSNFFKPAF